jgi:Cu/Ag efflux pump CusA
VAVTEGVEDALEKLRPGLSGLRADTSVFRPATFIEDAIENLTLALVIGGVLLALIVAALLFQWRAIAISLIAIPVSLLAAALVLDLLGESFNAISFAGLAVALALVVDDAIAGAENIARRLREHRGAGGDRPAAAIVLDASSEVRRPLTYATLITLLAIVPLAVMSGRPGAFFAPLVLAYALAIVAAMVVAMTVTPALGMLLFARGTGSAGQSPLLRRVASRHGAALAGFVRWPRTAVLAAGACVVAGLAALPFLSTSIVPTFKDRDVLVRLDGRAGTSNARMTQVAADVSRRLRAVPGVDGVGAHVGRAVTGDQIVDVNSSEVWASVESDANYDATLAAIKDVVRRVPDVERDVVTYSTQKIRDVGAVNEGHNPVRSDGLDALTGSDRPLVVRVFGQNLDVLRREANRVRQMMAGVDGVVDPRVELPAQQPTLQIAVDLDKARREGIKPGDVRRAEATLLQGIQVGSVFQDQKVFDVVVQGVPATRASVSSVRNLLLDKPDGGHVRLGQVADVRVVRAPTVIQRDAVSRRIDVAANISGRSLGAVTSDVEDRLANLPFPLEYHAEIQRESTAEEIGTTTMLAFAIGVAIAMFLLLQAAFHSWRLAVLALVTVPVALTGGALAALIGGAELTLGSLIGFLAVFGIAVRNGLVLICHYQRLQGETGNSRAEVVQRGTRERLTPVLATALGLAALSLPLIVLGARPGLEVVNPMAIVLLGGLVTSTFLVLFVLPALYVRFGADTRPDAEGEEEELMERWLGVEPEPAAAPAGAGATAGPNGPAAPPPEADAPPPGDDGTSVTAAKGTVS